MKRSLIAAAVSLTALATVWAPAAHALPNDNAPKDIEPAPPTVKVSVSDASITEGNAGSKLMHFSVSLSKASAQQVTVTAKTIAAVGNAATAGSDYGSKISILQFAPGITARDFAVSVYGDTKDEPDERFGVTLSNVSNAGYGKQNGMGTINDDDFTIVQPEPPADPPTDQPADQPKDDPSPTGGSDTGKGGAAAAGASVDQTSSTTVAPTGEQALDSNGTAALPQQEEGDSLTLWLLILTAGLAGAVALILLWPPRRRRA